MANSQTGSPWVLDTPSATPLDNTHVFCDTVEWSGYDAGAEMAISDRRGVDVIHWTANADLSPIALPPGTRVRFDSPTLRLLSSGVVRMFLS